MSIWPGKKQDKRDERPQKKRLPLTLWLFYAGMITMSLTGVTFSRYSTVVHGTISVEVAASYTATYMDADGETEIARTRVYEGQSIEEVPDLNVSEAMLFSANLDMDVGDYIYSDEDTVYRTFVGWSLDGETVVDPRTVEVDQDLVFIAVYEVLPEPLPDATPSDATPADAEPATPSDAEPATPSDASPA